MSSVFLLIGWWRAHCHRLRIEGDVTIIPVFEETVVVEKKLTLKEEIHIRRRSATEIFETAMTLRRQRAEVTRSK